MQSRAPVAFTRHAERPRAAKTRQFSLYRLPRFPHCDSLRHARTKTWSLECRQLGLPSAMIGSRDRMPDRCWWPIDLAQTENLENQKRECQDPDELSSFDLNATSQVPSQLPPRRILYCVSRDMNTGLNLRNPGSVSLIQDMPDLACRSPNAAIPWR